MTIGATTGKEPDYIEDGDLKSLDEMRGAMKDMAKAKLSLGEKATIKGMATEIEVLKQQLEMTHEQLRSLVGLYGTLRGEFHAFQSQRVAELTMKVNNGSTTPEDMNGNEH